MTKLILATLMGIVALGFMAGTGIAQAAPPSAVRCIGGNSVWDDTDIVHLTKEGAGTLVLTWTARGHTTLNCGPNSPLTGQVARIEERVRAQATDGVIQGQGHVRLAIGNKQHTFNGRFRGTATINQGNLGVMGIMGDFDLDADVDGNDFLALRQHGTVNLAAKQWTNIYIDDIIIGLKKP